MLKAAVMASNSQNDEAVKQNLAMLNKCVPVLQEMARSLNTLVEVDKRAVNNAITLRIKGCCLILENLF